MTSIVSPQTSAPMVLSRTSPTQIEHLTPGGLYQIKGQGDTVDLLPTQLFRYEQKKSTWSRGTVLLVGTLWWRVSVSGRVTVYGFSGFVAFGSEGFG